MTDYERAGDAESCTLRRYDVEREIEAACPPSAPPHP
jgi:hypothetical protein